MQGGCEQPVRQGRRGEACSEVVACVVTVSFHTEYVNV